MPVPIICVDEMLHHFARRFSEQFSKPQYQHFVIVLLGLMACEGTRTLSGLLRQIAAGPGVAGLSRFLLEAPWDATAVAEGWLRHFCDTMQAQWHRHVTIGEARREMQRRHRRKILD